MVSHASFFQDMGPLPVFDTVYARTVVMKEFEDYL